MFPESAWTDSLRGLTGAALRDALLTRFRQHGWSESTLEVVERADVNSVAAFRFNASSTRARDLAPWPAGRMTALGDAVHATPPTAGMGAGAAIRDAAGLVNHLRDVRAEQATLPVAVGRFEAEMRLRGSEMLTLAMRTVRLILATDTRFGAVATGAVLPALALVDRFRRGR
jgi:2-polyprenyl-6-methoxyphenol hydroxylase-like FAD-dependent oxidoreductase